MFQLAVEESATSRSQSGALKTGAGSTVSMRRTYSRNRASPCCHPFLKANAPSTQTSRSCGRSSSATGSRNARRFGAQTGGLGEQV
ncbi:MAG: hypothetical protein ABSC32_14075 [Steroidobacteraceae bacterium]